MKWGAAISDTATLSAAFDEVRASVEEQLGGASPDLVVAFVSGHGGDAAASEIAKRLAETYPNAVALGGSAGGVIGGGRELERAAGITLTAAVLPGVELTSFDVDATDMPPIDDRDGWRETVGAPAGDVRCLVLLADPFTTDVHRLITGLDAAYPEATKVGGLASGGRQPGDSALILGGGPPRGQGAIGVAFRGDLAVDAIVAQGCRPIGDAMFVTSASENLITHVNNKPPATVIRELFEAADERDRDLMQHSLFIGVAMRDKTDAYEQGDFLIRNLIGIDPKEGAVAIGASVIDDLQVVQFHVRDARTSAEDLDALLARYRATHASGLKGSLIFSCLGRGESLYGRPNHDSERFAHHLGDVPLGGFFCNGEIGPVGRQTYVHGYTSSFALFRALDADG